MRFQIEQYRDRRRRLKATDEVPESSIEFASLALLIAFLLYVSFGALLLPLLNGQVGIIGRYGHEHRLLMKFLERLVIFYILQPND